MGLFDKTEPISVGIRRRLLACLVRGHEDCWRREAQLNTAAPAFFNLDWANPSGLCYVRAQRGYIHWFLPP